MGLYYRAPNDVAKVQDQTPFVPDQTGVECKGHHRSQSLWKDQSRSLSSRQGGEEEKKSSSHLVHEDDELPDRLVGYSPWLILDSIAQNLSALMSNH
jgi:hypothetical protein